MQGRDERTEGEENKVMDGNKMDLGPKCAVTTVLISPVSFALHGDLLTALCDSSAVALMTHSRP